MAMKLKSIIVEELLILVMAFACFYGKAEVWSVEKLMTK